MNMAFIRNSCCFRTDLCVNSKCVCVCVWFSSNPGFWIGKHDLEPSFWVCSDTLFINDLEVWGNLFWLTWRNITVTLHEKRWRKKNHGFKVLAPNSFMEKLIFHFTSLSFALTKNENILEKEIWFMIKTQIKLNENCDMMIYL